MPGVTDAQISLLITDTINQMSREGFAKNTDLPMIFGFADASNPDGPQLDPIAEAANASGATFTPGAGYSAAGADSYIYPYLGWGAICATVSFTDQQLAKIDLADRSGRSRFAGMLQKQTAAALRECMVKCHEGAVNGAGTTNLMLGLDGWIAASNNIAGYDRAVYANFGCYVNTTGGALSAATIENGLALWRATYKPEPGNYIALCDYKQERRFKALTAAAFVPTPNQQGSTLQVGYSSVAIDGGRIPVVGVSGLTGGVVYVVNLDAIKIESLFGAAAPFQLDEGAVRAQGSDTHSFSVRGYVQQVLQNPRKNAMAFTGLTDS